MVVWVYVERKEEKSKLRLLNYRNNPDLSSEFAMLILKKAVAVVM